ncbi:MAG: hypothetical protein DRO36_03380 [Candidatus Hecatellales archaeon]|nr:MAG: hypothetical protein DRO36_03380 [Candidatus Hecatellales archaeon]
MPKAGRYEYPDRDLDSCVEKVKKILEVCGESARRETVAEALGMSAGGGGFNTLVASMAMYGLVETGEGIIKTTELAKRIIYGEPKDIEDAKSKAVKRISIFTDLYRQYGENVTEEQLRAFLRDKALVDLSRVQKIAEEIGKIYKKVAIYLTYAEKPTTPTIGVDETVDKREKLMPEGTKAEPLKIQYGSVYIQVPPDDAEAIAMAKAALEFMEKIVREKQQGEK